jgi:hypothetical protein
MKTNDTILKKIIKRQLPFLIGGTITGAIMTYYYGFLFSIIVNSASWMLIPLLSINITISQQASRTRNTSYNMD